MAITTPCSGPINVPVEAKWASCCSATSSASGMPGSSSTASVMLRALRASNPQAVRRAGLRFKVIRALMRPARLIVVIGPRIPSGSLTQGPL